MKVFAVDELAARLNPLRLLPSQSKLKYERLPHWEKSHTPVFSGSSSSSSSVSSLSLSSTPTVPSPSDFFYIKSFRRKYRWRTSSPPADRLPRLRLSPLRLASYSLLALLVIAVLGGFGYQHRDKLLRKPPAEKFPWEHFARLNGFYNGIDTIVPKSEFVSDQEFNSTEHSAPRFKTDRKGSHLNPVTYTPYPDYESAEYTRDHLRVRPCYLDEKETVQAPDIFAYPGLPQGMTDSFLGSHELLGLNGDVCFDRFGRYGPYGYGYSPSEGGLGIGNSSERVGSDKVWKMMTKVDYRNVDWGKAQRRCYEKNKERFEPLNASLEKRRVPRTAYVLRTWTGYQYSQYQIMALRAMINELSLKSGGEFDVHFLVHVKDNSIPIWASDEAYQETLEKYVPAEFRNLATLWSEAQIALYYPEPFPDNLNNDSGRGIHDVYRSAHFALQWFAQKHPDYDHYWNWEMDVRLTGHYYEFHNRLGEWAKQQPRKGLWARNSQFYIPAKHQTWEAFSSRAEKEAAERGDVPVWGPVHFPNNGMLESPLDVHPPSSESDDDSSSSHISSSALPWGVGEEADLITLNPMFDPNATVWPFRNDVTGYSLNHRPPPRRAAIITISRLSKRLLDVMHEETWRMRHHMFPEMWSPTIALHHGFKAVYAPHPVYFDRNWPLDYLDNVFNHPKSGVDSVFGWGEHNFQGSSFYYNSGFAGALWRRWLGQAENSEGGPDEEKSSQGRMCLRTTLLHPIKFESNGFD